jgi:hypothetical protein
MEQLTKTQSVVYMAGGILMVLGAAASLFGWVVAPYIYSLGALGFVPMQMLQRYDGQNVTIRRLRRILIASDMLFLLTGVLMFASLGNAFGIPQIFYVQYIYNKWVGTLLLAAVIQLYAIHRLDYEFNKEAKKR